MPSFHISWLDRHCREKIQAVLTRIVYVRVRYRPTLADRTLQRCNWRVVRAPQLQLGIERA